MAFRVNKENKPPLSKIVSFRLPARLVERLREIAEAEDVSTNALVKQMLDFCAREYAPIDKKGTKK